MREDQIIAQLRSELQAATPDNVDVRTSGGDQDVDPPEIVLQWDSSRLADFNGHTPLSGRTRDNSGNATGNEYQMYFSMEVNCVLRYYDEVDRDTALDSLHSYFLPFERDSDKFDADTFEWEVGTESPQENPVVEPDWYETGLLVSFNYVKRATETKDAITSVDTTIERTY